MKLLLVDDDVDQLELRVLTLARAGFGVYSASDETTALEVAKRERPDVAVVDLRLPTEEAGLHLIRGLKKLDDGLRVIVLTGASAKRFESLPERTLVEAVITKGSASRQLLQHLMQPKIT